MSFAFWLFEDSRDFAVEAFIQSVLESPYLSGEGAPIPSTLSPGRVPLFIVTGENASGKSVLRRIIVQKLRPLNIECINTSQEKRAGAGGFGGIQKVFIYGDEQQDSTGYNSASTVITAINTARSRTKPHVLFLDEPDTGLSDEYASGMGQFIADFVKSLPSETKAVFVVSHNRFFIKELLPLQPYHWRLGDTISLEDWLKREITPKALKDLKTANVDRWRAVEDLMRQKRKR